MLGNDSRLVCGTIKTMGYRPPELCFNWTTVLRGVGAIGLFGFLSVYGWRPMKMRITVIVCDVLMLTYRDAMGIIY